MGKNGMEWAEIPAATLNIPVSLASGQAFRWRRMPDGEWRGVIGRSAVRLRPERGGYFWQTYPERARWEILERYFALDVALPPLYARWSGSAPEIAECCARFAGTRILRQDAREALFAFLCACCNTIVKIRRTIDALARRYGEPVAEVDGETYYAFPSVEALAAADEAALRRDLWGFRAPRVIATARFLLSEPEGWLEGLRYVPREEAAGALAALPGIGAKIADCVALFGLWHDDAVPIDTHIRQIAVRLFRPDLAGRSLTPAVYNLLADEYRDRFGPYAGWAQQYLFFGELGAGTTLGAEG